MMEIEIIEDNLDKKDLTHLKPNIGARAVFFIDNRLCLVHAQKTDQYTLPGGGKHDNETLEEALKREVLEETGYTVKSYKQTLTLKEYFSDSVWHHHYFFVEVSHAVGQKTLTKEEQELKMQTVFKPLDEVLEIFAFQDSDNKHQNNINKREMLGLMHSLE